MVPKTTAPEMLEEYKYELMVILYPDMSDMDTEKELSDIRKQIKDLKGEIYHEDIWNIRDLSYRIKKQDKGFYAIFYFTIDPLRIKEIDKSLFLNQKVIRHMVIKSPKGYVMKNLSELELTEEERKRPRKEEDSSRNRGGFKAPVKRDIKEVKKVEKPVVKAEEPAKPKKEERPAIDISDLDSKLESILDDSDLKL